MLGAITRRSISLLGIRSWRNFVAVLLVVAVPAGVLSTCVQRGWLPLVVVVALAWCVLVAGLTACAFVARWRTARVAVLAEHIVRAWPRAMWHASVVASPLLVVGALLALADRVHPLLILALLPFAFIALPLVGAAVLMAIAAIVMGDRAPLPAIAITFLRRAPWKLAGGLVLVGAPVLFASLPVACLGLIIMAALGPLGWFGIGLALVSPVPFYGALGVAAWRELGGGALDSGRGDVRRAAKSEEPAPRGTAGSYVWQPGPSWQLVLDPLAPWGTWVDLAPAADGSVGPRTIGVTVEVIGVTMPRLLTCDEAGTWLEWPVPRTSGTLLPIELPVGASYVQLITTTQVACHAQLVVSTQEWVAATGSAAA